MQINIADVRLKATIVHYGIEFFHHLRLLNQSRAGWPWDFLLEYIDDLEQLRLEHTAEELACAMDPLSADEALHGLRLFTDRMTYELRDDIARRILVNRFYSECVKDIASAMGSSGLQSPFSWKASSANQTLASPKSRKS